MDELIGSLASFPEVKAVQMVESSGTPITSIINDSSLQETYVAALTADIVTKLDDTLTTFVELDLGGMKSLLLDLENSTVIVNSVIPGQIYIVTVCNRMPSNLGLIMLHADKVAQQLASSFA